VKLAYSEPQTSKSSALKLEAAIKKLARRHKELLVKPVSARRRG
jgi:predicted GIY-YIG superfamily endonuclease